MEDSDVLNNTETQVPKSDPVPHDVDPDQTPTVIEQDTGTVYKDAVKPAVSPVVGENNHAESIANNALNNAEAKQTFSYTSQGKKDYDESVTTTTTQSTGANMTATWDSEMKMDSDYTVDDNQDYTWNKLANEMAELDYAQEQGQARYESMQSKQELDKAASQAWNNYFAAEYSARQTQDKMGWSGGQQTASDLQVSFLQAETAANMYTQDEMQRYGVETKLGIARMYAEANQKALALQYYQDAVDQSIKEAEQTGWYIPAEASEMFKQDEMAREILKNPQATAAEKERANKVLTYTQAYYDSKHFQHGYAYDDNGNVVTEYYGIKCLQTLQYEETKRNNKVNEELQAEANKIAQSNANAAWKSVRLQEKQLEFNWSVQNYALGKTIVEKPQKTATSDPGDWYEIVDSNGKVTGSVNVPKGSTTYKYNNTWYYLDSENMPHKVYNANKTTLGGALATNYKERK